MAQPQRGSRSTAADELERASAELDGLIADLRLGTRNAEQFHDFEARAQQIADRVRGALRRRGTPQCPPIKHGSTDGRDWGWW